MYLGRRGLFHSTSITHSFDIFIAGSASPRSGDASPLRGDAIINYFCFWLLLKPSAPVVITTATIIRRSAVFFQQQSVGRGGVRSSALALPSASQKVGKPKQAQWLRQSERKKGGAPHLASRPCLWLCSIRQRALALPSASQKVGKPKQAQWLRQSE